MLSIHVKQYTAYCKHYFRMTLATIANRQPAAMVSTTGNPSLAMADAVKAKPSATNASPLDMVSRFIALNHNVKKIAIHIICASQAALVAFLTDTHHLINRVVSCFRWRNSVLPLFLNALLL